MWRHRSAGSGSHRLGELPNKCPVWMDSASGQGKQHRAQVGHSLSACQMMLRSKLSERAAPHKQMYVLLNKTSVNHNYCTGMLQVSSLQFGIRPQLPLWLRWGSRRRWSELSSDWPVLWGSAASSNQKLWKFVAHPVHLRWLQQLWWLCSYLSREFRQVQSLLVMWVLHTYTNSPLTSFCAQVCSCYSLLEHPHITNNNAS